MPPSASMFVPQTFRYLNPMGEMPRGAALVGGKNFEWRLCKVALPFKTVGHEQAFVYDDEEPAISTQHTKKNQFTSRLNKIIAPRSTSALQYRQTFGLVLTCVCCPVPFAVCLGVLPPSTPGTGTSWRNARSCARPRLRCPMGRGRRLL